MRGVAEGTLLLGLCAIVAAPVPAATPAGATDDPTLPTTTEPTTDPIPEPTPDPAPAPTPQPDPAPTVKRVATPPPSAAPPRPVRRQAPPPKPTYPTTPAYTPPPQVPTTVRGRPSTHTSARSRRGHRVQLRPPTQITPVLPVRPHRELPSPVVGSVAAAIFTAGREQPRLSAPSRRLGSSHLAFLVALVGVGVTLIVLAVAPARYEARVGVANALLRRRVDLAFAGLVVVLAVVVAWLVAGTGG